MSLRKKSPSSAKSSYESFSQLDGQHSWQSAVPEGSVLYPVRKLSGGRVSYFNFDLAREMGLIARNHPSELNAELEKTLLNTFCLRIINEYDQEHGLNVADKNLKEHPYMATRYLQLQHTDKSGRTSGDGRCIWNGEFKSSSGVWDVSSRGTGVTSLAPGVVEAGKPLKSGNTDHGYGCGMAEIDELYGAAILAEIFHRNGISTERVLAVIDIGKGVGIGVRAAPNLVRPAHLFLYLKQNRFEPLKAATDYLISRQFKNGEWQVKPSSYRRYRQMLSLVVRDFAKFAAYLERDYIFAWLDWDGDNVLANAGIIDYGSVRQFGLRHDQYRYDDVDRMSTNLNEQKAKAAQIVQTFAQMVDYLETGSKKAWAKFSKSRAVAEFNKRFEYHSLERFLYQLGLPKPHQRILLRSHRRKVENLFQIHCDLEKTKTYKRLAKVHDGVHRPAIFNMRRVLSSMTEALAELPIELCGPVDTEEFFSWMVSSQAAPRDRKLRANVRRKIEAWQQAYFSLLRVVTTPDTWEPTLAAMHSRAMKINDPKRITGNALIHIVDEILKFRRRTLSDSEIQLAIDLLIKSQTLNPDYEGPAKPVNGDLPPPKLMRSFMAVVRGYGEDI